MLTLYTFLTYLLSPLLPLYLRKRVRRGKEDPARLAERYGIPSINRPNGKLLWCHAASVGESLSVLPLLEQFLDQHHQWQVLVTSGTVTSAILLAEKLPPRAVHQYLPLDVPQWVRRFHRHWHPDLVMWVESELWPNHLRALKNIPVVLVNARITAKSAARWQRFPKTLSRVMQPFSVLATPDAEQTARWTSLLQQK